MLWFYSTPLNISGVTILFQYISCYGSTKQLQQHLEQEDTFQYISCYGSTGARNDLQDLYDNFNTSHVMVLLKS